MPTARVPPVRNPLVAVEKGSSGHEGTWLSRSIEAETGIGCLAGIRLGCPNHPCPLPLCIPAWSSIGTQRTESACEDG